MSTLRVNSLKPRTGNTVTIVEGNTLSVTGIASVAGTMNVTGQANFASGATVTGVVTFSETNLNNNLNITGVVTATSFYGDGSNLTGIDATQIVNGTSNVAVSAASSITFTTDGVARASIGSTGHFVPSTNNTYDLGNPSNRWRNIYTNDLQLSNEGSSNDVDGTWGSWVIQEGEDDLFLINRRSGKKYKFNLTEVN